MKPSRVRVSRDRGEKMKLFMACAQLFGIILTGFLWITGKPQDATVAILLVTAGFIDDIYWDVKK